MNRWLRNTWNEQRRLLILGAVLLWVGLIVGVYRASQPKPLAVAGAPGVPVRAITVGALPVT